MLTSKGMFTDEIEKCREMTSPFFPQILVLLMTLGFLGVGIWGTTLIRQEFDPVLLLPASSYMRQWINKNDQHFPSTGWGAEIYTGALPLKDLEKIDEIFEELKEMSRKGEYIKGTYVVSVRNRL